MTSTLLVVEQLRRRVPGGVGTYARGLIQGLTAVAGRDREVGGVGRLGVTLLASATSWRRSRPADDPLPPSGLRQRRVALPGPLVTRAWGLGALRAPSGYDVVHGTSFALPRRGVPAMTVMVHDLSWRRYPETTTRRGRRWHERGLRDALAGAAGIVVPSAVVGDQVHEAGAPRDLVTVIPHGCDHLPAADHGAAHRLLVGAGVVGPFVLSVGTLEPRKNLTRLVHAYRLAVGEMPDPVPLVVVGPQGWGDAATVLPGPSGSPMGAPPGRSVVTVGAVPAGALSALYQRARALVYVPVDEGFGLPPMEAALAGTPVVASAAVPSMDGGTDAVCERVDPFDPDDIARGILHVLDDPAHASRLAGAAAARARSMTWEVSARAHLELWAKVAGSPR